jgi:hypothetical protein
LGCVTPIGDQGGDIAKTAAIAAGWNDDVAGVNQSLLCIRFRSSQHGSNESSLWLGRFSLLVALNQCHVFQWVLMVDRGL